ncbi:MAG: trypsin-like serine protease [Hyphomonadaceae bacterium]
MRMLAAAATIAACVLVSVSVSAAPKSHPYGFSAAAGSLQQTFTGARQAVRGKPPRVDGGGNDSCRWARDNECDEPGVGTGACRAGTDRSDCARIISGQEDDSCRWAHDHECDEPNFGTGACVQGTARSDCGDIAWLRNQTDTCATAFNGVCEEPGQNGGGCAARTDRSDCRGRNRPMTINDHFFGHDDRVLVPVNEAPWRFMGTLRMDTGEACSATLVARDVIVTAAHCIHTARGVNAAAQFEAAVGGRSARVIAYLVDRRYNYRRFTTTNEVDGLDWALLRIDQPLGDELGYAGIQNLTGQGSAAALAADLMQAGYSWDTGAHLSGNLRCHMIETNPDNTFAHECDTTRGDSGSAFLVRDGAGFDVIGVDSNFRSNPDGPFINIAVSAASFAAAAPDFIAGRTGVELGGRRGGRKAVER